MNKFLCGALAAAAMLCAVLPLYGVQADAEGNYSKAECVVEVSSRRILHAENATSPLPMASTTKVLTAIIVIEDCDLTDVVEIPAEAAGTEGSSIYLRAGEKYTVEELLYGLMLRSGNDAAVALAFHHSGSISAFAHEMTVRAAFMGASDSVFSNPHGLPAAEHRTTARDLALIAAHAMQNAVFRTIVSTRYYAPRGWTNKNKMLSTYDGAIGIKTGFTSEAGRCLVTGAERNGMTVVSVVLNSPSMYERSAAILDNAFHDYTLTELCSRGECVEGCRAEYDFSYPLTQRERETVRREVALTDPLPASEGEIAGQMRILLENRLLFSQNLYMMER